MKLHPEQQDGEIYMGNFHCSDDYYFENDFHEMCWQDKRLGKTPYNNKGEEIVNSSYKPGFITILEVQNKIDQLNWEIQNVPCSWNSNKLKTIKIYQDMIDNRTVFKD